MSTQRVPSTQVYDLFKAAVTFILLFIVLVAVALNSRSTQAAEQEPQPTLAPVVDLPPAIRDAVVVAGCIEASGTGQAGSLVQVRADGAILGSAAADEGGSWSLRICVDPGEYQLVAVTLDSGGSDINRSASFVVLIPAPTALPTKAPLETTEPMPTLAPTAVPGEGQDYIVQQGDWLMGLARQFYGDGSRWEDIYSATNAKAAEDPSYATIYNPNVLTPGWKIWIPLP